ncbi:hypothetical protein SEA_BUDSKI_78 [Gordonia phage Budski]|nr:hypothetical protein SEA_BUDSKI_78 [Gordonia phage Budski]
MIVFEGRPAQYRGTIEVYAQELNDIIAVGDDEVEWTPEWRWRCKSRNGQILAQGEGYNRKAGALNAIKRLFSWAPSAEMPGIDAGIDIRDYVTPWRLVVRDRHGDITTTGAVY